MNLPVLGGPQATGRSPHWPAVRRRWLRTNPVCAVLGCGRRHLPVVRANDVHHVTPFHLNPELELDPNNLITLCRPHHLTYGHFGNWRGINVWVRRDTARGTLWPR